MDGYVGEEVPYVESKVCTILISHVGGVLFKQSH
jgi:hypothetical protein